MIESDVCKVTAEHGSFSCGFRQKRIKSTRCLGQQLASRFCSGHASTLLKCPWAKLSMPDSRRAIAAAALCNLPLNPPEKQQEFLFRDQYCNYNIYICPTFLTLLVLVILKCGAKTDKQAAFLWRAQRESCLITVHTSDEDNAAVARILNLFYWRKRRSHPEPNMVINTSPCSSLITLTAYMCVSVLFIHILYLLTCRNNEYVLCLNTLKRLLYSKDSSVSAGTVWSLLCIS